MNKERRILLSLLRDELTGLRDKLEELMGEAEELENEEQEAYDNMPESLQCSGRGERMQECIDGLEEVYTNVSNGKEALDDALSGIEEVLE